MKYFTYIFIVITLLACDSENAIDCFQTAGNTIQQEIEVESFDKILVNRDITLVVRESTRHSVLIETGSNLINDVDVKVKNNQLILTDNNNCNLVRDFGITKITVSTPTLSEIRTSTQYTISSEGELGFENLTLISENFNMPGTFTVGDFDLQINANSLTVVSNGLSAFYLRGSVNNLSLSFFSGQARVESANLIAQNVEVFHRGSNDMIVNPQQSITGSIVATGNVIAKNQPPIVDVEELFNGRLIFN
ncbi:DUF2807 domain-containing protein [Paucihalobacter ruber]|uniref:DUF2807 domain-containing protein n=1 Tax=Paucihalobacter ruber TaxID=2567861 RepID=A0A506PDF7_9FLAO|nr:head GIN domain-containing protein [Paucihalobacter ruber]TPV31961.1 DUF2807 domain-containing protein [Paucihalobacter ruber]